MAPKTDKLECSINGSGTINLKAGNAEEADYSITTDGEIMAFGVAASEVNCKITGKGSAQIHPTDNLKATIVGKGNIRYKGPTAVQQKIIGKGTVEDPCGYTKYSCNFQTSIWNKIPR